MVGPGRCWKRSRRARGAAEPALRVDVHEEIWDPSAPAFRADLRCTLEHLERRGLVDLPRPPLLHRPRALRLPARRSTSRSSPTASAPTPAGSRPAATSAPRSSPRAAAATSSQGPVFEYRLRRGAGSTRASLRDAVARAVRRGARPAGCGRWAPRRGGASGSRSRRRTNGSTSGCSAPSKPARRCPPRDRLRAAPLPRGQRPDSRARPARPPRHAGRRPAEPPRAAPRFELLVGWMGGADPRPGAWSGARRSRQRAIPVAGEALPLARARNAARRGGRGRAARLPRRRLRPGRRPPRRLRGGAGRRRRRSPSGEVRYLPAGARGRRGRAAARGSPSRTPSRTGLFPAPARSPSTAATSSSGRSASPSAGGPSSSGSAASTRATAATGSRTPTSRCGAPRRACRWPGSAARSPSTSTTRRPGCDPEAVPALVRNARRYRERWGELAGAAAGSRSSPRAGWCAGTSAPTLLEPAPPSALPGSRRRAPRRRRRPTGPAPRRRGPGLLEQRRAIAAARRLRSRTDRGAGPLEVLAAGLLLAEGARRGMQTRPQRAKAASATVLAPPGETTTAQEASRSRSTAAGSIPPTWGRRPAPPSAAPRPPASAPIRPAPSPRTRPAAALAGGSGRPRRRRSG